MKYCRAALFPLPWEWDSQRRWTVKEGTRTKGNWTRLIIEIPLHVEIKVYLLCCRYRKGASHLRVYGQHRGEGKVRALPQPATMHISSVQHSLSCQGAILRRKSVGSAFHFLLHGFFFSFNYGRHHCQTFHIFHILLFSVFLLSPRQNVNNRGTNFYEFCPLFLSSGPCLEKSHRKFTINIDLDGWTESGKL